MTNKTLKAKIEIVCWSALGLTILYFLIGAWLISDGPKFDPAKTYNLLKDTLTLTAAFLAPVAAFVLFSDWRDEHKKISNIEQSRRFNEDFKRCLDRIETDHEVFYLFEVAEFESFMRMLFDFSATTSNTVKNIYDIDAVAKVYVENIALINKKFENLFTSLQATILYAENKQQCPDTIKICLLLNEADTRNIIIGELRNINLPLLKV